MASGTRTRWPRRCSARCRSCCCSCSSSAGSSRASPAPASRVEVSLRGGRLVQEVEQVGTLAAGGGGLAHQAQLGGALTAEALDHPVGAREVAASGTSSHL